MRKFLIILLLVAAAAAGGWSWWTRHEARDATTLTLHGNVDIRQVSLAFDNAGRVLDVRVEEGDAVKAGQVLALLDTRTLELQAQQQAANVEAQRQTVLRLRNGSRPEEIDQARAQLASAEATAAQAAEDATRADRLKASSTGVISQQNVDQRRADAQAARAKVDELRAALRLAQIGPRPEEIAGAEAQPKSAEASLALLRHQIELGQLRAPVDAVVRSRLREPGDMVSASTAVLALALTEPKWVRVYVGEPDLGKVRPGMAASVFTDSHPDQPIAGKVGYISSVAEFTPKPVQTEELRTSLVYEVRVIVEDAGNVLRLGQPATVRLALGDGP